MPNIILTASQRHRKAFSLPIQLRTFPFCSLGIFHWASHCFSSAHHQFKSQWAQVNFFRQGKLSPFISPWTTEFSQWVAPKSFSFRVCVIVIHWDNSLLEHWGSVQSAHRCKCWCESWRTRPSLSEIPHQENASLKLWVIQSWESFKGSSEDEG